MTLRWNTADEYERNRRKKKGIRNPGNIVTTGIIRDSARRLAAPRLCRKGYLILAGLSEINHIFLYGEGTTRRDKMTAAFRCTQRRYRACTHAAGNAVFVVKRGKERERASMISLFVPCTTLILHTTLSFHRKSINVNPS